MFVRSRLCALAAWGLPLFLSTGAWGTPALPIPGKPAPVYSLNDCLQLALERNPSILKAQRDIERTQGLIITAKSTLYPQLSLNGRVEERDDDLFSQGQYKQLQRFRDFWTIQLTVTQSLYSGGANRQQIAIAKLQHEASLIQFQGAIDQVLRDVKFAAYTIVVNQAQIDAQTRTVDLLTKEEARQKDLFDAGRTTRFNILRTEVNLGNQRATLNQTQNDLIASELALSKLLAIEWPHTQSAFDPPFQIRVELNCPPIGNIQVSDFIALALTRRPEIRVLDRQVDIAERQIKLDRAAVLPRVYAYAADETARDENQVAFHNNINDYAVGLLGTWNVFDGFSTKGQVMSDEAALGSTSVSRDAVHLQVQNEVREAYARLLNAQATIQAQTENVKTAEEAVGLARLSADTGYATLLDVLQATIDLTSARSEEIRTKQLYMDAMADLEHAVSLKFVDWPGNGSDTAVIPRPASAELPADNGPDVAPLPPVSHAPPTLLPVTSH